MVDDWLEVVQSLRSTSVLAQSGSIYVLCFVILRPED